MQYNFTAKVENQFDEVARGELMWTQMLSDFYGPFHSTIETMWDAPRETGERILGKDPETGMTVLTRMARFGPVVQIGTQDELWEDQKPRYANVPPDQSMETVTLEVALGLFGLPKHIGTFNEKEVVIGMGRFGPYIKYGEAYVSIPRWEDPLSIDMERAEQLIAQKEDADKPIFIFEGFPVTKGKGRFGPFIKWNGLYINVPKLYDFDNLTEEEGIKLIEWKKQKEANRYISRWEEEDIAIENGRYGPFIRYKKLSIPLKYQGKKIADDSIPALTLEQVKWIMLEQNPDVFWKVKKAESDTKKKTAPKKAATKKKA